MKKLDEARAKREAIESEISDLAEIAADALTNGQRERLSRLNKGLHNAREAERQAILESVDDPDIEIIRGDNPRRLTSAPDRSQPLTGRETPGELRSRALSTVEGWSKHVDDSLKEATTRSIERATDTGVLEHIVRFSDPVYESAWRSWMSDPHSFADLATGQERAALRMGREEARATLQTSGAVLPSPLDPTIHLSSAGIEGSLKSKVSKRQTTSNVWRGITSAGITASYDAEAAEVSDDTPALTGTTVTTRKAQAEAVVTLEAYFDQPEFSTELAGLFADAKNTLDATVIWNGASGSNQPVGIWTAIDGGSYEVTPTTSEAFGWEDVYLLPEAVLARHRNDGEFAMELSTYHYLHQTQIPGSTSNPVLFEDGQLIGRPYSLSSAIDAYSDINVAATADNPILVYGDFSGYFWVDRVGMVVMPPVLLQNSNAMRFDGTFGVYCYWRSGGDILIDGSLAVLNIATTA